MRGHLLRILGLGFGLAVGVGAAVGGEILRLPGGVAKVLPDPRLQLMAWALGGLCALLGALSFAELGTRVPRTGGLTTYAEAGFGPFAGFAVGWSDFLASGFTVGAYALVVGEIATALGWPGSPRTAAILGVALIGAIQAPGLRPGAWTQDLTSAAKALGLVALGAGALWAVPVGVVPAASQPASTFAGFMVAMQLVIFAYDNYYGAVYFTEEYEHPGRQLPRALLGGVVVITALYVLLAWGMARALPWAEFSASDLPGALLAERLVGGAGGTLVRVLMLVALLSGMNATALIASRVAYALGMQGEASRAATAVNAGGTPVWGLGATLILAVATLVLPSFEAAIAFMSPFLLLNYLLCFASLLRLRQKEAAPEGAFLAPGFPITTFASLALTSSLLIGAFLAEPALVGGALGTLALAWPLWRWTRPRMV